MSIKNNKNLTNSNPLKHFCNRQSGLNTLKLHKSLALPSTFRQNLFEARLNVAKNLFKKVFFIDFKTGLNLVGSSKHCHPYLQTN